MELKKGFVHNDWFRGDLGFLPYNLRQSDFVRVMEELYDFMYEVNCTMVNKGWQRLEDIVDTAAISALLSSVLGSTLARNSRSLVVNSCHNGHPDLLPSGRYPNDSCESADEGVEIKATINDNAAVDMHGAREKNLCTFVYEIDNDPSKTLAERAPLEITQIYLGHVSESDFRRNDRGALGTRTATLDKSGLAKYRPNGWIYLSDRIRERKRWFIQWARENDYE